MNIHQEVTPRSKETAFTLTIDGRAENGTGTFDVINPATEEVVAQCPSASLEQLDEAVAAARKAFHSWRHTDIGERRARLNALADRLLEHKDEVAHILTLEQGKPLSFAQLEIQMSANIIRGVAAMEVKSEIIEDSDERRIEVHHNPLGVVGAITPWNVPVVLAAGKIASALITGCTVVLKPSPYTPLSTLMLGQYCRETLPAGVVNVLSGGDALGQGITDHPDIDKITFTGSIPTGKKIMAGSANNLKRLTLELGGNDAAIVLNDVEPRAVAKDLFWGAFKNSGQICVAIKRIYVHESIYDEVCDALGEVARNTKTGDGMDPETQLGPIQNKEQYERVLGILEDTKKIGARFLAGGEVPDRPGYFLPPTIVADIAEGTRLVDEEPFGPIVPVIKYSDIDDAIARANDTRFGLGASVWTNDPEKGAAIAARLEAGSAWVNQHGGLDPRVPFGGCKESGLGFIYSVEGLKEYTTNQVVNVSKKKKPAA